MIILLIAASIFSAVISYVRHESFVDSIIIIIIVFVNAILSFIQEKKADVAIEELSESFQGGAPLKEVLSKKSQLETLYI